MTELTRLLPAAAVLLALAGCGDSGSGSDAASQAPAEPSDSAPAPAPEAPAEAAETAAEATAEAAMDDASDAGVLADGCELEMTVGDSIAYSVSAIRVPASCSDFTLNLIHEGALPVAAMGHNWVLVPTGTAQEIATAGMSAGVEGGYLAEDERIIAATDLIGGGETSSVTFSLEGLAGDYSYVCTFPGHWGAMRGTFTVMN